MDRENVGSGDRKQLNSTEIRLSGLSRHIQVYLIKAFAIEAIQGIRLGMRFDA